MKLSDRELVLVGYAVNAVLTELTVGVKDRAVSILYVLTLMNAKKGEVEELSNYQEAVKQLRRIGEEADGAFEKFKAEMFKEMSDA